jgi:hypothetical protein
MKILLLEDDFTDADLTKRSLRSSIPGCEIDVAPTLKHARELLTLEKPYDFALLDMKLPDGTGLDLLMEIRQKRLNMPVIILTGSGNEEVAVTALKAGANDYVVKHQGYTAKLAGIIDFAIINFKQGLLQKADIIDVLYIEHHPADIDLTIRHLNKYAPYIHLDTITSSEGALSKINDKNKDAVRYKVILMDYRFPGHNSMEFIKLLRQDYKLTVPIILITGQGNEDIAVAALKLGVSDYVTKSEKYLYRLPSLIVNAAQKAELEKKQAALFESEAKYRLLAENSGDVIFVLDMDLNFTYISPAVKNLRGFDHEEAIKQNISDVLTPDSYEKAVSALSQVLSSNADSAKSNIPNMLLELEMIRKDKTTVWTEVKVSLMFDNNNQAMGIIGTSRDISQRKHATDELRKLSRAIEQSPASVVITDLAGSIEYVNPRFSELTGYSLEEVKGKNPRVLKTGHTKTEEYKVLWETICSGDDWRGEFQNKRKDGSIYWEQASISPIKNSAGKITHFIAVKEDVTERKKMMGELVIAKEKAEESDRLKTSFLHNISHEIRTPLNAIIGFSTLLTDPLLSAVKREYFNNVLLKSSDQLLAVITGIINIATIEAGQEKLTDDVVNINLTCKLLEEQFTSRANDKRIVFRFTPFLSENDANIITDKTKLIQILTNLLDNAFKFTKEGQIEFGYVVKENKIEFHVKDTGIGIQASMQDEIFKRFRQVEGSATRQYGGSGLGLTLSKAYVELLGGKIWLNSRLGKGTELRFTVPYKKEKQDIKTELETVVEIKTETVAPKTILIAEDEDYNFMFIEAILSRVKFEIIRAENGVEAVEMCKSNPNIDLVLMDIKMPIMNGYEATTLIKEFMPDIPIIAVTAYSTEADKNKAFASGCTDFLSKPFKGEMLIARIKQQLLN